jgi:ubiquinone/menaquinone biosynthesis C-methylase UbiE
MTNHAAKANCHSASPDSIVKCRICHSASQKLLHKVPLERPLGQIHSLEILRCLDCGLVFSGLELGGKASVSLYSKGYYESEDSVMSVDRNIISERYRRTLDRLQELKLEGKELLDVGCGCGEFIKLAESNGWECHGLDISPWAAQVASEQSGVSVFVGTLAEAGYPSETFDVVTAWDVIEHIIEPQAFVAEVRRILKLGGMLVVRTPNQNSLFHLLAGLSSRAGWSYPLQQIYHVDHLSYFTESTLVSLLYRESFRIETVEYEDITIHDTRFRGWQKAAIAIIHLIAEVLKKHHAMIVFARAVP